MQTTKTKTNKTMQQKQVKKDGEGHGPGLKYLIYTK